MSRLKKKISDPEHSIKLLMNRAVSLFGEPYDDRDGREAVAQHTEIGANGEVFFHYNAAQTAQSASMQHIFVGEAA